jgi:hypothetical protein
MDVLRIWRENADRSIWALRRVLARTARVQFPP